MDQPHDRPDVLTRTLELGWRAFLTAWPLLLVASLAIIGASIPGSVVGAIANGVRSVLEASGVGPVGLLWTGIVGQAIALGVTMLLAWPVQAGASVAAVRASRGHVQDFGSMLAGFRRFGASVGAMFLYSVIVLAANAPGLVLAWLGLRASIEARALVFGGSELAAVAAGVLWTTVAGLVVGARLSPAPMRAADPDLPRIGAAAAIAESWAATRGHTLAGVGMLILAGAAMVVGLACCCIGVVLFGMPLWLGLQAGFYRAVFAHAEPPPPPPAPAWTGATPPTSPDF